jgi:hypothetical protein
VLNEAYLLLPLDSSYILPTLDGDSDEFYVPQDVCLHDFNRGKVDRQFAPEPEFYNDTGLVVSSDLGELILVDDVHPNVYDWAFDHLAAQKLEVRCQFLYSSRHK